MSRRKYARVPSRVNSFDWEEQDVLEALAHSPDPSVAEMARAVLAGDTGAAYLLHDYILQAMDGRGNFLYDDNGHEVSMVLDIIGWAENMAPDAPAADSETWLQGRDEATRQLHQDQGSSGYVPTTRVKQHPIMQGANRQIRDNVMRDLPNPAQEWARQGRPGAKHPPQTPLSQIHDPQQQVP